MIILLSKLRNSHMQQLPSKRWIIFDKNRIIDTNLKYFFFDYRQWIRLSIKLVVLLWGRFQYLWSGLLLLRNPEHYWMHPLHQFDKIIIPNWLLHNTFEAFIWRSWTCRGRFFIGKFQGSTEPNFYPFGRMFGRSQIFGYRTLLQHILD